MASGDQNPEDVDECDGDDYDEPDRGNLRRVQHRSFRDEATYFLQSFIVERFQEERIEKAPTLRELRRGEVYEGDEEELDESWRRVGMTFKQIAVNVDQSVDFQRVAKNVPEDATIEDIMSYIRQIFSDGKINWGRIVALFCFAYNVCARKFEQFMEERFPSFPSWITKLITAIIKFLIVKFADWIINRGGWQSIQEYFGTKDLVWKGLMLVSITLSLSVILLHLKR